MTMRRYSGYCAWRGVLPEKDKPHIAEAVRKAYPELGSTLYFDIARTSHAVLYQLPGPRLNWLWYPPPPHPSASAGPVPPDISTAAGSADAGAPVDPTTRVLYDECLYRAVYSTKEI